MTALTVTWVIAAFLAGFACRAALHRTYIERQNRIHRRIGWAYGYGAGYADAQRDRPASNVPPADGRARHEGVQP